MFCQSNSARCQQFSAEFKDVLELDEINDLIAYLRTCREKPAKSQRTNVRQLELRGSGLFFRLRRAPRA